MSARQSRRTTLVTAADGYGDHVRISLGEAHYGSVDAGLCRDREIGTGLFAKALWVGRRHVVLLTYSQWVTRTGSCTGDTYRLCDVDDVRMICDVFGEEAAERALDTLRVPVAAIGVQS